MKKALATVFAGMIVVGASYLIPRGAVQQTAPEPAPMAVSQVSVETMSPTPASQDRLPEVERLIDVFETRVAEGNDALDMWTLGGHYLDRAALTGDVGDYRLARDVLERAYETNAGNPNVDLPLAQARLALHDFAGARRLAEPFAGMTPVDLNAIALTGDAALGLGDVESAAEAYQRLLQEGPEDPAVAVRLSSLSFQTGDRDLAIEQAREALRLSDQEPAPVRSFYTTYLGLLHFETGQFNEARTILETALELDPGSASAMIELGHVLAAQGETEEAIAILERSMTIGPEPEVAALLGDLYVLEGETERAEQYYGQVEQIAEKAPEAYRRDVSRFLSDHDRDPERALRLAEDDLKTRQDSGAYDTLAWALYRNGRYEEARTASDQAISVGTSDASAFYHAGVISLALGERERGLGEIERALDINPHFSPLLSLEAADLVADRA